MFGFFFSLKTSLRAISLDAAGAAAHPLFVAASSRSLGGLLHEAEKKKGDFCSFSPLPDPVRCVNTEGLTEFVLKLKKQWVLSDLLGTQCLVGAARLSLFIF